MESEQLAEAPVRWAVSVFGDSDAPSQLPEQEARLKLFKRRMHLGLRFRKLRTKLEAHDQIVVGLPTELAVDLGTRYGNREAAASFYAALGISERTFHRYKSQPAEKPLVLEVSARLWKLAEIIGRATEALGSREEADAWLQAPAMALDGRRPMDLLATPTGVEAVEDLLTRLRYDVYT